MRAVVLRAPASSPQLLDVDLAGPGPGEVRVRIAAAGVCHSDLHVVQGDWPLPMPVVLGHEGSGTVVEVGADVTTLAVGDPVVLSWVAPCGRCRHEARCELAATVVGPGGVLADGTSRLSLDGGPLFHYLGVSSFAEEAVVPASGAIKVRPDVDLEQAALLGCAVATGVGAVRNTAAVQPGSSVVVIGCGGVGLSVVQGARLAGAERIVAVDLVAAKTEVAQLVGASDAVVPSASTDAMLGLGGAAVVVGLPPSGATASFEPLALAEADQRILGSNYGGIRPAVDIPRLVDDVVDGRILLDPLVSGRRPMADAGHALEELASGSALRTLLVPELRS
jgi:S-(hydroxymethyl)glutathione dehydrogenase/alcohol dehydrogenase